jgi:hypothetical protein
MSPTSYQAALPRSLEFLSVVHSLVRVNHVVDLKSFREVNAKTPRRNSEIVWRNKRGCHTGSDKHDTKKKRAPRRIGGLSEVTVSVKYLSPFSNS